MEEIALSQLPLQLLLSSDDMGGRYENFARYKRKFNILHTAQISYLVLPRKRMHSESMSISDIKAQENVRKEVWFFTVNVS